MTPLFKKLNLTTQDSLLVVGAPTTFEAELAALDSIAVARAVEEVATITFALAFVTRQDEVDSIAAQIAGRAPGDALVWFAYPKGSSKRYRCEFNRDTGWAALGELGFEPVRQVAIDEDWSALRFRRVEHIKSMTRDTSRALSEAGRAREK